MHIANRPAVGCFMHPNQEYQHMKMKHTSITAMLFAGALTVGSAHAATTSSKDGMQTTTAHTQQSQYAHDPNGLPMLAPGVQELSLGGRINWEDSTAYSFDVSYGRFITSNWLLGVQAGITGINSDKDYRVGVFAEYNFLTGTKWVPFVRAGVGYTRPDQGSNSGVIGLDAGVKYFMRPNMALFASAGGDWVISGSGNSNGFAKQIDFGLKFYF